MKSLRAVFVVSIGLLCALWWAVMPPVFKPEQGVSLESTRLLQCPAGSGLQGKLCNCPEGSNWTGAVCSSAIVSEKAGEARKGQDNLVFARGKVPSLPVALASWPQKLDAINSPFPRVGAVAMIERWEGAEAAQGRLAIVEKVGERSLTIIEGNDLTGELTRHTASGRNLADAVRRLHIAGFYQP